MKLLASKWIYTVSFTVQSMQLIVYLVCMYCWISVLKPWHDEYAISRLPMCFWHVVASGSFDCPNVCSTAFAWDTVYAKLSGFGILDHFEHVDVFLTRMWTVLLPLLACSLLIFLSFDIVMIARQLCLWVSYCVPVACFTRQGLLDILMTTNNFLLTSNTYRIKKSRIVWSWSWRYYDSWKCINCLQSTQQIFHMTWGISNTAISTSDLASINFMTRTPHSLSCALDTRILNLLWHSLSNAMNAQVSYANCIENCHCWISNYIILCNFN